MPLRRFRSKATGEIFLKFAEATHTETAESMCVLIDPSDGRYLVCGYERFRELFVQVMAEGGRAEDVNQEPAFEPIPDITPQNAERLIRSGIEQLKTESTLIADAVKEVLPNAMQRVGEILNDAVVEAYSQPFNPDRPGRNPDGGNRNLSRHERAIIDKLRLAGEIGLSKNALYMAVNTHMNSKQFNAAVRSLKAAGRIEGTGTLVMKGVNQS